MKKCKAFAFSLLAVFMIGLSSCEDKQSISIADNVVISDDDIIIEVDFSQLTKKSNINKYLTEEVKNDLFQNDSDAEELFNNLTDANGKGGINTSAKAYVVVQPKQARVFSHMAIKDADKFEKLFTQNEDIKEIPSEINGFKAFSIASDNITVYFNNQRALFIQSPTEVDVKAYFESTNTLAKSIVAPELNSKNNDILLTGTYGAIMDSYAKLFMNPMSGARLTGVLDSLYLNNIKDAYYVATVSFEKGQVNADFKTICTTKEQEQSIQQMTPVKPIKDLFTKYIPSKAWLSVYGGIEGNKYAKNIEAISNVMNQDLNSSDTSSQSKQNINQFYSLYYNFLNEINGDVCLTINDLEVSMFAQKINCFAYIEGDSEKLLKSFTDLLTFAKAPINKINDKLYSINIPEMQTELFFGTEEYGMAIATNKDFVVDTKKAISDITTTTIYSKKDKAGFFFINFDEIFSNENIQQILRMFVGNKFAFLTELDYLKLGMDDSLNCNAILKVKNNNINILELITKNLLDN